MVVVRRWAQRRSIRCLLGLMLLIGSTGCQVDVGETGIGRPQSDDVQYFVPGTKFPLSREAATIKAYDAETESLP